MPLTKDYEYSFQEGRGKKQFQHTSSSDYCEVTTVSYDSFECCG